MFRFSWKLFDAQQPARRHQRRRLMVEPLDARVVLSAAGLDPTAMHDGGQIDFWQDADAPTAKMHDVERSSFGGGEQQISGGPGFESGFTTDRRSDFRIDPSFGDRRMSFGDRNGGMDMRWGEPGPVLHSPGFAGLSLGGSGGFDSFRPLPVARPPVAAGWIELDRGHMQPVTTQIFIIEVLDRPAAPPRIESTPPSNRQAERPPTLPVNFVRDVSEVATSATAQATSLGSTLAANNVWAYINPQEITNEVANGRSAAGDATMTASFASRQTVRSDARNSLDAAPLIDDSASSSHAENLNEAEGGSIELGAAKKERSRNKVDEEATQQSSSRREEQQRSLDRLVWELLRDVETTKDEDVRDADSNGVHSDSGDDEQVDSSKIVVSESAEGGMVELVASSESDRQQSVIKPSSAAPIEREVIALDARVAFFRDFEMASSPAEDGVEKSKELPVEETLVEPNSDTAEPADDATPAGTGIAAAALLVSGLESRKGRTALAPFSQKIK